MRKTIFILFLFFFSFLLFFSCGEKTTKFEPDFAIILKPVSDFVIQSCSLSFSVKLVPVGGFNSEVELSIADVPDSVQAFLEDSTLTPPDSTLLWMKADSAAPVGQYMLALSGSGGGKTNNTTLALKVVEDLKLYFAKDGEKRILSLNPDTTDNVSDFSEGTPLSWGEFLMNQDFTFDTIEIYFYFFVEKIRTDVKGIIHFEVYFDSDSIYADDWKRTFDESDTSKTNGEHWYVDTMVVELESLQAISKQDEIKVTLKAQGFDICRFLYDSQDRNPYIRFH